MRLVWILTGAVVLGSACKPEQVDPIAILRANRDAMFSLRGYQAKCTTSQRFDRGAKQADVVLTEISTLIAEKPNRMLYHQSRSVAGGPEGKLSQKDPTAGITFVCDGTRQFLQFGKHYRIESETSPEYLHTILEPWSGFYVPTSSFHDSIINARRRGETAEATYDGEESVNGVLCQKVKTRTIGDYMGRKVETRSTIFTGKKDHLVRREVRWVAFDDGPGMTSDAVLTEITLNKVEKLSLYRYTPPPGVTKEAAARSRPKLLANGTAAPDFEVLDAVGKKLKLSDHRGKVVLIDFWASWCGPCIASMPHTQNVVKKLQDEGLPLVALAVDDGEPREGFLAWTRAQASKYSNLVFASSDEKADLSGSRYNVSGIPTQYVVDPTGKISASFVGFSGENDDLENAIRAALK